MPKYMLPFYEYQRGYYIIEAESLSEAKKLVDEDTYGDWDDVIYRDGEVNWDSTEIQEML